MKFLILVLLLTSVSFAQRRVREVDNSPNISHPEVITRMPIGPVGYVFKMQKRSPAKWVRARGLYPVKTCVVSNIFDGDNIGCTVAIGREKPRYHNLRILGIDAPEVRGKQPYYLESRAALATEILNKRVQIEVRGFDSIYQRHIVSVKNSDGIDLGLRQVEIGGAWYFPRYARTLTDQEKERYQQAMERAQNTKLGLWGLSKPIPPAEWRKGKRSFFLTVKD
jgi:endonuclease YncB( thermonuclease family)